jgi:hypothetical protein
MRRCVLQSVPWNVSQRQSSDAGTDLSDRGLRNDAKGTVCKIMLVISQNHLCRVPFARLHLMLSTRRRVGACVLVFAAAACLL